jgi:hypothetical protein
VLPTDPDIGAAHTEVVAGPATLHAIVADELVAIATTIFAAVRRLAPFGLRGMWGNFADGIAEGVVWRTRNFGEEAAPARRVALQLVDALADRVPALTVRPRFERVAWSGGTAWLPVKSTCCLYYKTFEGSPDPCGDGYCTSCPFRDDAWRLARWATWLETNA